MKNINIRIDENLKKEASDLFKELGIDMTTAIVVFLRQSVITGGIPFEIKNSKSKALMTKKEVEEIFSGKNKTKKYNNVAELFKDLDK